MMEVFRYGKTPNGGTMSLAIFLDDDEIPVDKSLATQVQILELDEHGIVGIISGDLDEKGEIIVSIHGTVGAPRVETKDRVIQ